MNERPTPPMAATPGAETPYAPACPQRGVVGKDATAEAGDFSMEQQRVRAGSIGTAEGLADPQLNLGLSGAGGIASGEAFGVAVVIKALESAQSLPDAA